MFLKWFIIFGMSSCGQITHLGCIQKFEKKAMLPSAILEYSAFQLKVTRVDLSIASMSHGDPIFTFLITFPNFD